MLPAPVERIRRLDAERPSLPGEHWATFAAGLALLRVAARGARRGGGPGAVLTALAALAGAGLVARAASGRDGPLRRLAARDRGRGPLAASVRDPVRDPPYL